MEADERYRFDGFTFDPETGELHRSGSEGPELERLPPKPARLLALLLERPGELVAREEVIAELWGDQHLDTDQALAYTVRQVRAALGDDAGAPRYVETLPRRGYRFVGTLEESQRLAPTRPFERPAPGASDASANRRRPRSGPVVLLLILGMIAVYGWFWLDAQRQLRREMAADPATVGAIGEPVRIALLPLVAPPDVPGGSAIRANDRLTERLLVALAARPELDLVGPATTARLRATTRPHPEVGRELGVAFVASGGYRPGTETSDGTLFLQLVRTSDGGHVFAERLRGTETDLARRLPTLAANLAARATEQAPALSGG